MIHIEVIQSPDSDVRGSYKYFQNQIYIGRKSEFLQIFDNGLNELHLMLEVIEGQLYVHPQPNVPFYLIDGKRATNIRKIKSGQVLKISNTSIKVIEFETTDILNKKQVLDAKLSKLIEEGSPRLNVIEKLGQMMK